MSLANGTINPINLSYELLKNIDRLSEQNNTENLINEYDNSHINPPFRYYNNDTNFNLTPQFMPNYTYKNKSLFPAEKPSQTEHDETPINTAFLNSHYGYTNYGNFYVANQSLPDKNKHKYTNKDNLYDLF
jgi:hypothetical protein